MRIDQIELSGSLSISSSLATNPLVVNDDYLFVSNTGNVGIGTNNPTSKLVVTGSVSVRGGLRATTLSGSFTGSIKLPTIPLGTSETNIVLVDGSGGLVYRSNLSLFSIFNEEFINTISSTLTFTKNNGVLPTLNLEASIQVYQNGQKLFTNQYTITPPNIITINADTYYEGSSYSIFVTLIN